MNKKVSIKKYKLFLIVLKIFESHDLKIALSYFYQQFIIKKKINSIHLFIFSLIFVNVFLEQKIIPFFQIISNGKIQEFN